MKRVLALTSAALMATSMLAYPVLADDDRGGGSDSSGSSSEASSSSSSGAESSGSVSADDGTDSLSGAADAEAEAGAEAEAEASGGATEAEDDEAAEEAEAEDAVASEQEGMATDSSEDVEHVVAAIESSNTFVTQIGDVGEGATVTVVNIGSITNNMTVENTINVHADDIANLQNAIASNGTLMASLEAEDVNVSSIVGASAKRDQVILYELECSEESQSAGLCG